MDWFWVPDGSETWDVLGARVVRFPAYIARRMHATLHLTGSGDAAPGDLIDAVLEVARAAGESEVRFHVAERPEHDELLAVLLDRGRVEETLAQLAFTGTPPPVAPGCPGRPSGPRRARRPRPRQHRRRGLRRAAPGRRTGERDGRRVPLPVGGAHRCPASSPGAATRRSVPAGCREPATCCGCGEARRSRPHAARACTPRCCAPDWRIGWEWGTHAGDRPRPCRDLRTAPAQHGLHPGRARALGRRRCAGALTGDPPGARVAPCAPSRTPSPASPTS